MMDFDTFFRCFKSATTLIPGTGSYTSNFESANKKDNKITTIP